MALSTKQNNLYIIQVGLDRFIGYWKKFYQHGKYPDSIYFNNIKLNEVLHKKNIKPLIKWKFGVIPSKNRDNRLIRKIIDNLDSINSFRKKNLPSIEKNINELIEIGLKVSDYTVAATYTFHLANPKYFPIFDRFVFEAFKFIIGYQALYLKPASPFEKRKDDYFAYRKFFLLQQKKTNYSARDLDKALMAFGKWLSKRGY